MWRPFNNKSGVAKKCMDEEQCVSVQSLVTKQHIFVLKRNFIEKGTSEIFDCTG